MSMDLAAFGIDRLSVADRIELIEVIWDSLPESVSASEIPDAHLEVIAERRTAAEVQPGVGRPWRDVLNQLDATS
jgi:putative addiction module component (TIGR02574 family)